MSTIYNLEPQPTASVILHTTAGDISLSLFAQQTPLTSRNFLQHCLDGYYDSTIFHRLVAGFILQGGDPTGTGNGGESIYDGGAFGVDEHGNGERGGGAVWPLEERSGRNAGPMGVGFRDEWHSRIKFNRRGLLGMANDGGKDSNGSQFFFTLGETPELQGKNTCFGRVEGDTIYNLARMGEAEVAPGTERPVYPTKITGAEILVNPFSDMKKREKKVAAPILQKKDEKKKKRKAGKQLLSFGDDDDGDDASAVVVKKAKFDSRIVMDDTAATEAKSKSEPKPKSSHKERARAARSPSDEPSPEPAPTKSLPSRPPKAPSRDPSSSPEPVQKVSSLLDRTNAQIAELKASMRRNVPTAPVAEKKKSFLEDMIPKNSVRGRKRHPGGAGAGAGASDQRTLDILKAFQSKLEAAPPEKEVSKAAEPLKEDAEDRNGAAAADEDNDEEAALCDLHFIANCQSCQKWETRDEDEEDDANDKTWMSHTLSFKEDKLGKDLSYRKKAEEELVVIDPLQKARTLKEEHSAKRAARQGGSGRAWDQSRNEKLARSAAFDGRGAK